jgi:hypothetical protein
VAKQDVIAEMLLQIIWKVHNSKLSLVTSFMTSFYGFPQSPQAIVGIVPSDCH